MASPADSKSKSKKLLPGDLFPYKLIRAGQDKLLKDIQTALENKEVLIANAPTGLGKTASALSAAISFAIEKDKTIFFLTNRHTQHRIAVETLQLIREKNKIDLPCADIIGKRWMCSQKVADLFGNEFNEYCKTVSEKGECEFYNRVRNKKGLSVEAKRLVEELAKKGPLHSEDVISYSRDEKMCGYEISLALAKNAQVVICDYYYLFNPFVRNAVFTKLSLEMENIILIVDEGHNLPGRITEMLSNILSSNMLRNAIMEAKKYKYGGMIIWLQELMHILAEIGQFADNDLEKEKLVEKETFIAEVKKIADYDELVEELELAADEVRKKQRKSYLGGISSFLAAWKGDNKKDDEEGFTRLVSERKSKFGPVITLSRICLDPSIASKEIFARICGGMIMSGTLKPMSMYKEILGIESSAEKEYASPFPVENKLSLIIPETSTKYNLRGEAMYKRIGEKCSEIASLIPGNMAFFFPSYELRDQVGEYFSSGKKKFWEKSEVSKEEKEAFLAEFKAEKEKGGVLLGVAGANYAEGIDLPGDLLKCVVVVGLPLARPNLKTRETIKHYDKKFAKGWEYGYIYPAISKCVQSAGRCIRSETDKGAIIFLDERFAWKNYYDCLPHEGLIVSKDYQKLLKEFFG
ncbi:MAG: ATP-dependent DNA helicase [Nanoarchaeota archaeon]